MILEINTQRTTSRRIFIKGKKKKETFQSRRRHHHTGGMKMRIFKYQGYKKYGSDWDGIVKWGNLERTATRIKERYRRLTKKVCKSSLQFHISLE